MCLQTGTHTYVHIYIYVDVAYQIAKHMSEQQTYFPFADSSWWIALHCYFYCLFVFAMAHDTGQAQLCSLCPFLLGWSPMEAHENPMEAYGSLYKSLGLFGDAVHQARGQGLELGCSRFPRELRSMEAHTMVSSGGVAQDPVSWSLGLRSRPGIGCQFVFSPLTLRSQGCGAYVWSLRWCPYCTHILV